MAHWTPEQRRAWYAANGERVKEVRAKYRAANRERIRAQDDQWRAAHPETVRAVRRATQPNRTALQRKRHAAKLRATPAWADHEKIRAVYAEAARLTRETGVPHEVDHFYPLQGKDGSRGLHVHENLRILPARKNRAKGSNPPC